MRSVSINNASTIRLYQFLTSFWNERLVIFEEFSDRDEVSEGIILRKLDCKSRYELQIMVKTTIEIISGNQDVGEILRAGMLCKEHGLLYTDGDRQCLADVLRGRDLLKEVLIVNPLFKASV